MIQFDQERQYDHHRKHLYDFSDKIIILQKRQQTLKNTILQLDLSLRNTRLNNRIPIMKELLAKSQKQVKIVLSQYSLFLEIYRWLLPKEQKTYAEMVRKLKFKLDEQKQEVQEAIRNPHQQIIKIQTQKSIWTEEEETESRWRFYLRGIAGILGAFLLHLLIGAIYRWSMINPYVTSFFKITNDPYITTKENSIGGPLSMLFIGFSMKLGLKFCNEFGLKVLVLSVILLAANIVAASYMPSFVLFVIFHNCFYGFCAGLIFLTPMRECHRYFPKLKLHLNALILAGTGLGAALFGVLNIKCMNPEQFQPQTSGYFAGQIEYVARKFPQCISEMSYLVLVLGIIGVILLYSMVNYNNKEEQILTEIGTKRDFEYNCYTEQEALKSPVFWVIGLLIVLGSTGNYFVGMNYKNLISKHVRNQLFLDLVVFSGALGNGLSRLFWGLLFRKIGFKWLYLMAMVSNIICFIGINFTLKTPQAYLIVYTIISINIGGLMVLFPNLCLLVFGQIIGESIYGYYWAIFSFSNFLQYFIGLHVLSQQGFGIMFFLFVIFAIIGLIICICTKFQGRWQNSLQNLELIC